LKIVAYFSALQEGRFNHHVHHTSHHVFTSKTPRFAPRFLLTPSKKHQQKQQNRPANRRHFLQKFRLGSGAPEFR
jgi:hypothetical protein